MRQIILNYYVEDAINALKKCKCQSYGIKDTYHALSRAQKRNIDLNIVTNNLCNGQLVGIEKSLNETSIFQLLYEYRRYNDLCIVINILNDEEIEIITLIEKDVNRRRHYEN